MIRQHLNQRHDEFVEQVACWCLRRGLWVRLSAQEVSGDVRYSPDLELYSSTLDRSLYIECKVCGRNIAVGLDELLHQRALKPQVVVVARCGSVERGFLLRSTLPDAIYLPGEPDHHLVYVAEQISARWGIPLRRIPARPHSEASNIPFAIYYPHRFRNWQDVVAALMGVKSGVRT